MEDNTNIESIKGDRSMTQGFVAQYASEAALQINGVLSLVPSFAGTVSITVYPIVKYGMIIPEIAWMIQEKVKKDVERFTGLTVESVDVYVCGVEEVS